MKPIIEKSPDSKHFHLRRKDRRYFMSERESGDGCNLTFVAKCGFADIKELKLGFESVKLGLSKQSLYELHSFLTVYVNNNYTQEEIDEFENIYAKRERN